MGGCSKDEAMERKEGMKRGLEGRKKDRGSGSNERACKRKAVEAGSLTHASSVQCSSNVSLGGHTHTQAHTGNRPASARHPTTRLAEHKGD